MRHSLADKREPPVLRLTPDQPTQRPTLLDRLMERKIVQWFIAYAAVAWIILQFTEILAGMWNIPITAQQAISLTLGLGACPALVVAWYHGEMGRQRVCLPEVGIVGMLTVGVIATVWRFLFL
jgi:adenylate cyclase